jgi:MFS family permease
MTDTTAPPVRAPVSRTFIAGLTLAQVGAFLSFTPLLSILVPLKAAAIDPVNKAAIMAEVSLWAAVMAGVANLLAGAVSDRTLSRFGRRRPWIALGLAGTVASYLVIMGAGDYWGLLVGLLLFQLCFNLMFGPLVAILPDQVPDAQKGRVSAFAGLAPPLGAVFGVVLTGVLLPTDVLRYAAIALILVISIGPFVAFARDPPSAERAWLRLTPRPLKFAVINPVAYPDFAAAWLSRLLMQLTLSVVSIFALFYLQDRVRGAPGPSAEASLAALTVVATACHVVTSLAGGFLSDRWGRRKPFVIAGGLFLAAGTLILALAPTWPATLVAYALYGCGFGLYQTVDAALVAQVLPSLRDAGRDLGVLNLANTIPQILAPILGLWLLGGSQNYTALFILAAISALLGAVIVNRIRSVR